MLREISARMRRGKFTRGLRRVAFALTGAFALVALVPGAAVAASFGTFSYPVRGPVNARVDRATTVSSACPGRLPRARRRPVRVRGHQRLDSPLLRALRRRRP